MHRLTLAFRLRSIYLSCQKIVGDGELPDLGVQVFHLLLINLPTRPQAKPASIGGSWSDEPPVIYRFAPNAISKLDY